MVFHKGDEVIVNGLYSGIIVRATPERDMYVVRYRHRSENKLVNIMHRGGELDLMSPPRPNPPAYGKIPELWATFIHRLDPPLEFDTSDITPNMTHTKGLKRDQQIGYTSANFFFVPAEHPPLDYLGSSPLTLARAHFFDRFLTDFYQSKGWDGYIDGAIKLVNEDLEKRGIGDLHLPGYFDSPSPINIETVAKDLDFEFFFTSKDGADFTSNFGLLHEVRLQVPFENLRGYEDIENLMSLINNSIIGRRQLSPLHYAWRSKWSPPGFGHSFTYEVNDQVWMALEFDPGPDLFSPFYTFDYSQRMKAESESGIGQKWGGTIGDWLKDPANRNWDVEEGATRRPPLVGAHVKVVSGGLRGAKGEVLEIVTSPIWGDHAVVLLLTRDAHSRLFGAAGDEVIALVKDLESDDPPDRHLPYQQSEASKFLEGTLSDSPLPRGRPVIYESVEEQANADPQYRAYLESLARQDPRFRDWVDPYLEAFLKKLRGNPHKKPIGECYPFAFKLALEWANSQPDEESADDLGLFRVIHGRITNKWNGESALHAWVEKGGLAFDWQSRREGIPIDWYYENFNPEPFEEYSALDVLINCVRHGHYGPWEEDL